MVHDDHGIGCQSPVARDEYQPLKPECHMTCTWCMTPIRLEIKIEIRRYQQSNSTVFHRRVADYRAKSSETKSQLIIR